MLPLEQIELAEKVGLRFELRNTDYDLGHVRNSPGLE